MSVLVLCDHDRGTLSEASLEALTFGRTLAGRLNVSWAAVLIGNGADQAVGHLAAYGVGTVHLATHELLTDYGPEAWGETLAQLVLSTDTTAVTACGTDRGNEVLAQAAARLDEPFVANCLEVRRGVPEYALALGQVGDEPGRPVIDRSGCKCVGGRVGTGHVHDTGNRPSSRCSFLVRPAATMRWLSAI